MDYEQKYKNFVERLMKAKEDNDIADERYCCVIDELIPEPQEEDERIRKEIISYIKSSGAVTNPNWIAWLEKQGDKAFSVERVFTEAGIKPAYKDGNSWCVLIGENIQEGICGFGETPKDAYVNFLKELWGKAFEQKTSEWSEDDNAKIEFLCNLIKRNISEGTYSFGDGAKNGFVSKQEAIKMLKSLKPQSQWKPTKQQMEAIRQAAEQNRASEIGNILDNLLVEIETM